MKNSINKLCLFIVVAVLFSVLENTAHGSPKSGTVVIKTVIYCDHCKECASCGGKIQRDLSFDKGIQEVVLDEKAMTITVKYNASKTNPDEIRKKIASYGYDADEIKADPEAIAKLDECCKK